MVLLYLVLLLCIVLLIIQKYDVVICSGLCWFEKCVFDDGQVINRNSNAVTMMVVAFPQVPGAASTVKPFSKSEFNRRRHYWIEYWFTILSFFLSCAIWHFINSNFVLSCWIWFMFNMLQYRNRISIIWICSEFWFLWSRGRKLRVKNWKINIKLSI